MVQVIVYLQVKIGSVFPGKHQFQPEKLLPLGPADSYAVTEHQKRRQRMISAKKTIDTSGFPSNLLLIVASLNAQPALEYAIICKHVYVRNCEYAAS